MFSVVARKLRTSNFQSFASMQDHKNLGRNMVRKANLS